MTEQFIYVATVTTDHKEKVRELASNSPDNYLVLTQTEFVARCFVVAISGIIGLFNRMSSKTATTRIIKTLPASENKNAATD